jgi:sucrose phosphorylase
LFGSRGWPKGVQQSGRNRAINRQKLPLSNLEQDLADPSSLRHRIFNGLSTMLRARSSSKAFHPGGPQRVVDAGDSVLALLRDAPSGNERALCLQNVTGQPATLAADFEALPGGLDRVHDLLSGRNLEFKPGESLILAPYQTLWLSSAATKAE